MSARGTSQTGSSGRPPPGPTTGRITRSRTKTPVAAPSEERSVSPNLKKGKTTLAGEQAQLMLAEEKCIRADKTATPATLLKVLKRILEKYDSIIADDLHLSLQAFALLLQESADTELTTNMVINAVLDKVEEKIEMAMEKSMIKMSSMVERILANQKDIQSSSSTLSETAKTLKKLSLDMGNNVKAVMETLDQLTNTVSSYKEVLLKEVPPPLAHPQQQQHCERTSPQVDPKILRDVDRKARQILIDSQDTDITGASIAELREKVHSAINGVTNSQPPKDTTMLEINKLRKGGITILFKEKGIISWLQDLENKFNFKTGLAPDNEIVKCQYSILIPRIPLPSTQQTMLTSMR
ncbi:hypothetical protein EI94DRAFT_1709914 [Lactarius quietus]|nr:hypothetical protein EI94DRAFT_1709914 [Lactarius quietus]